MKRRVAEIAAVLVGLAVLTTGHTAFAGGGQGITWRTDLPTAATKTLSPCISSLPPTVLKVVRAGRATRSRQRSILVHATPFVRTVTQVGRIQSFYAAVCALRPPDQLPYVTTCNTYDVVYYIAFWSGRHLLLRGHINASGCGILIKGPPRSKWPIFIPTAQFWRLFAHALGVKQSELYAGIAPDVGSGK